MQAPRLAPEKRIPKDLATFTELSKFLSENNIKLFSREDHTKYDIINYHLEQNRNDDAFFIVDLGEILEQYKQWKTHLPRVKPFYAVKSCNNPMILKTLAVLGCGFHCSSKTEIVGVTDVDIPCNKILFGNPVKDPGHIKFARSQNVDFMVFDNEVELYKIKLYHPYAKLILRIAIDQSGFSKKMSSKFGCPLSDVKNLLEKARSLEIEVVGVSFHVGDKNTDLTTWTKSIENAREVFNISESMGMHMNLLNIGGGFPGTSKNTLLSFEEIAKTVNEAIDKYFDGMEDLKIIAEPGRYFSTKSHVLIFNVIGKRKIVEENQETIYQYYMNDGIYGSFSCIMYDGANPQISVFNVRAGDKKYNSMLFGPTCDDMDIITRAIEIPELGVGEWCYVEDFGAYTQVSSSEFSGFTSKENYYLFMY